MERGGCDEQDNEDDSSHQSRVIVVEFECRYICRHFWPEGHSELRVQKSTASVLIFQAEETVSIERRRKKSLKSNCNAKVKFEVLIPRYIKTTYVSLKPSTKLDARSLTVRTYRTLYQFKKDVHFISLTSNQKVHSTTTER